MNTTIGTPDTYFFGGFELPPGVGSLSIIAHHNKCLHRAIARQENSLQRNIFSRRFANYSPSLRNIATQLFKNNMRFIPAEPDIATVFHRIRDRDIDLQPDFQRGEVWSTYKKQRLIDTILRGWVIPPVLLISSKNSHKQQVLDGQQRLASIRDFMLNQFPIDGDIAPEDFELKSLHGLKFDQLPESISKKFLRTPVRMYEVSDYKPEEPAEIFFRLNQPTGLSPAEKRNAFFGPVRDQIRDVVENFTNQDLPKQPLAFSNSRMAYDDVFARFAYTLEIKTLQTKVTSNAVNQMYRRSEEINKKVFARLYYTIKNTKELFSQANKKYPDFIGKIKLNKATFYSWLIFFSNFEDDFPISEMTDFFVNFEIFRSNFKENHSIEKLPSSLLGKFIPTYNDRASARVADASSVLIRDAVLWFAWYLFPDRPILDAHKKYIDDLELLEKFTRIYEDSYEDHLTSFIDGTNWGEVI